MIIWITSKKNIAMLHITLTDVATADTGNSTELSSYLCGLSIRFAISKRETGK
jgi:hypothetical protein